MAEPPIVGAPPSLDWRNNSGNFVTPVRNQGAAAAAGPSPRRRPSNRRSFAQKTRQASTSTSPSRSSYPAAPRAETTRAAAAAGVINHASDYIRDTGLPLETCYPYTGGDGSCGSACWNLPDLDVSRSQAGPDVTTHVPHGERHPGRTGELRAAGHHDGRLRRFLFLLQRRLFVYDGRLRGRACRSHRRLQRRRPVLHREEQLGCGLGGVGLFQDRLLRNQQCR